MRSLGSDSLEQTKPQKAFSITYYRAKFIVIYICEGEWCMYGVYRVGVYVQLLFSQVTL